MTLKENSTLFKDNLDCISTSEKHMKQQNAFNFDFALKALKAGVHGDEEEGSGVHGGEGEGAGVHGDTAGVHEDSPDTNGEVGDLYTVGRDEEH